MTLTSTPRRSLLANFTAHGWQDLLFDYTMDEPHLGRTPVSPDWQHLALVADAVHAASPNIRTLVTTEFCAEFQDATGHCIVPPEVAAANTSGQITLWVPMMPFVAGRSDIPARGGSGKPPNVHCKDVPFASQRHRYDFIQEPERHLWWYLACFAEGGCCAGPQWKCTSEDRVRLAGSCSVPCFLGWPNYMVDSSAIRNRMVQWATYRYDMHGELVWDTVAAFSPQLPGMGQPGNNTSQDGLRQDAWEQVLVAGGNGEGTLWYPGRPDVIGGSTDVPVASLRLKMIREGQEDYEYLRMAERLCGRDVVLRAMSPVMTTATNYTADPLDIYATRAVLAAMIANETLPRSAGKQVWDRE